MEKLSIYKFQAEGILNALRLAINRFDSKEGKTCLDRDLLQAELNIKKVLAKEEPTGRERIEIMKKF